MFVQFNILDFILIFVPNCLGEFLGSWIVDLSGAQLSGAQLSVFLRWTIGPRTVGPRAQLSGAQLSVFLRWTIGTRTVGPQTGLLSMNPKTPPSVWHKYQDKIKNVELYKHFRQCALPPSGPDRAQIQQLNLIIPPNVRQKIQDRIKNVELYTHFLICTPLPYGTLRTDDVEDTMLRTATLRTDNVEDRRR